MTLPRLSRAGLSLAFGPQQILRSTKCYQAPFRLLIPSHSRHNHEQGKQTPKTYFSRSKKSVPSREEAQSSHDSIEEQLAELHFTSDENYHHPKPKVDYILPAVWALTVSSAIYVFAAYREASKEDNKAQGRGYFRQATPLPPPPPPPRRAGGGQDQSPQEIVSMYWRGLNSISQLTVGLIATNTAVHSFKVLAPRYWSSLWHVPAYRANHTLFTSAFVHSGAMHLVFNMWAAFNFLPPVGHSMLFGGSSTHLLAFYLSTAVMTGYAQHLAGGYMNRVDRMRLGKFGVYPSMVPSGGASGALFAVLGAFCMQYPTSELGIIFIPGGLEAQTFLPLIMLFDLYGMVVGFKAISFGHAAHFSGAMLGAAYSYFDGKNRIWNPLVQFFRKRIHEEKRRR